MVCMRKGDCMMAAGRKRSVHVIWDPLLMSEPREWAQRVSDSDGLIQKVA